MRLLRMSALVLCVLVLSGFAAPARADGGLCNRFMAALARALGDTTEEFKRRIAFLLETGKIGDEDLARMLTSDTAVSPFELGSHHPADVVPHATAFERLVSEKALTWPEVRAFIADVRLGLEKSRADRAVHERVTQNIVRPVVLQTMKGLTQYDSLKTLFEKDGRAYVLATSAKSRRTDILDAVTGQLAVPIDNRVSYTRDEGVLFDQGATVYVATTVGANEIRVTDAHTGERVREIRPKSRLFSKPAVFKRDGVSYLVVGSVEGLVYVIDPLIGEVVNTIRVEGAAWDSEPIPFEKDGKPYVIMANMQEGYLGGVDPVGGGVLSQVNIRHRKIESVLAFESKGQARAVVVPYRGSFIYVIDPPAGTIVSRIKLPTPAWKVVQMVSDAEGSAYVMVETTDHAWMVVDVTVGEVVAKWKPETRIDLMPPSGMFEYLGGVYALMAYHAGSGKPEIAVMDVFKKRVVARVAVSDVVSSIAVFSNKEDNGIYALVASKGDDLTLIQLVGPVPKDGEKK